MRACGSLPAVGKAGLLLVCFALVTACALEATPTTSADATIVTGEVDAESSPTTVTTVPAVTTTTVPKRSSSSTTTTTTPESQDVPFPWTYEGAIRREQTYSAEFGARGSNTAINDDHIVLTLFADGTTEGSYTRGGNGSIFECSDPTKAGEIYPGTGDDEISSISWTHSDGELIRANGSIAGTYDFSALDLSWTYANTISPSGCFDGTFVLEERWVDAIVPRVSP